MMRSITWQQTAVLVACLGASFAAHRFLGASSGMVSGLATTIVAFLMGRPAEDK